MKNWLIILLLPFLLHADDDLKPEDDPIVSVDGDDKEMLAAFREAKNSQDYFLHHLKNPGEGEDSFAIKYKVVDNGEVEYFWLIDLKVKRGIIIGTLNNVPNTVKNVKMGQKIAIDLNLIADWLYFRDGRMFGNFTLKPLMKKLPKDKAQQMKNIMADPQLVAREIALFNKNDKRKHLVMMIAEREYKTAETLPKFATRHLRKDFRITVLTPDPSDKNRFPGMQVLDKADVLLVSVRRRALPKADLAILKKFIASGKPVIGIRTANHAFSLRGKPAPDGHATWETWDADVFGGNYHGHHKNDLKTHAQILSIPKHPILNQLPAQKFATGGSLYEVLPLKNGTTILAEGTAQGITEKQPVAWTFQRADGGRSFYTSLGHPDDFKNHTFTKLLKNAVLWAANTGKENKEAAKAP